MTISLIILIKWTNFLTVKHYQTHSRRNRYKKKEQEESGNLKRSISIKWVEWINVNPAIHGSHKNFAQIFPQNESSGTFLNSFYDIRITLITKLDFKKWILQLISLMNIGVKILNIILVNQIIQCLAKVIHQHHEGFISGKQS